VSDVSETDGGTGEGSATSRELDLAGLRALVKQELAVSDYLEVSQELIDRFADVTLDRQWIHTDPERARARSPFGGTIAHGFLTIALLPHLVLEAVKVKGARLAVSMGLNQVRFPSAVPAGSRIRARIMLSALTEGRGWAQCAWLVTIERQGGRLPACVAEWLVRYYLR